MKTALFVLILTLASSVLARPSLDSEEYTDNNIIDSLPLDDGQEDDRADYVQM